MVDIIITVHSKQEYDDVRIEYIKNINASEITNSDDKIDDVWNVYNIQKYPNIKHRKFLNRFIYEDDRKEIICRKASRKLKDNLPDNKRKHNVSLTVFQETNTKTIEDFLVDTKPDFKN